MRECWEFVFRYTIRFDNYMNFILKNVDMMYNKNYNRIYLTMVGYKYISFSIPK
jgi:hypothetical protein